MNHCTPLHFAAEAGKGKMCRLLIQQGASVGITNSNKKTPMDIAATDYVREIMIVSNPEHRFKPSDTDFEALNIDGDKATIRPVVGLPNTDFYEPYEHAQPREKKEKPKINTK
jgi:ankyrin repeat protein